MDTDDKINFFIGHLRQLNQGIASSTTSLTTSSTSDASQNRRLVNNFISNYKPDHINQFSFLYGAKYSLDQLEGNNYSGYTDIYSADYGLSLGMSLQKNIWISLGYNFEGFTDTDFN